MIAIVDYGLGNVRAFLNVYKSLNIDARVVSCATELKKASHIILPGVGAFDHAMERLDSALIRDTLEELIIGNGVPVLGICVGMQILANSSEEGNQSGLSWIQGRVLRLDESKISHRPRLPHMGWNDVHTLKETKLFAGLGDNPKFYFLHSYHFQCQSEDNVLASADYGGGFTCAVNRENIYGVQFHPEKSHRYGTRLLKNFAEI